MTISSTRMLAAAIVKVAVSDYNRATRQLIANPEYKQALDLKQEVEQFFASNWFDLLCELSPDLTKVHLHGEAL